MVTCPSFRVVAPSSVGVVRCVNVRCVRGWSAACGSLPLSESEEPPRWKTGTAALINNSASTLKFMLVRAGHMRMCMRMWACCRLEGGRERKKIPEVYNTS